MARTPSLPGYGGGRDADAAAGASHVAYHPGARGEGRLHHCRSRTNI